MSSLPVSLSLSLSHPVGETVLSHTRTSDGELCQWFVLALWGRNKDGNMNRSEPTWAAKPPLLWASGSCLLCSILAGCSDVTLCSHKAPDGISKVGEEPSWYSAYRKAEPWISSVPPAWRKVFSVWWMEEQGGNAAVFEWDVRLELPRSGKQLVIISWPKSAEPFTLLGKGQVSLSDKRQGEEAGPGISTGTWQYFVALVKNVAAAACVYMSAKAWWHPRGLTCQCVASVFLPPASFWQMSVGTACYQVLSTLIWPSWTFTLNQSN